jgi:membrane-associated protease RseP (regulator of RpoE activity)
MSDTRPVANRPIWQLLLGFALFVGVLAVLDGWPLPFIVLAILLMVIFHELGHFLTARLTGMKASEFFVGFGPRLWSKQVGETEYGIKAYPLGGYVRILGMNNTEEVPASDEVRTFRASSFPRRVLVASAGSLMHALLALILVWVSLTFFGPVTGYRASVGTLTKFDHLAMSPAQLAGLHHGDQLVSINGHLINQESSFGDAVNRNAGKTVTIVVRRAGHLMRLRVTPLNGRTVTVKGKSQIPAGTRAGPYGLIGVRLDFAAVQKPESALSAIPGSVAYVGHLIGQTAVNTIKIFTPSSYAGLFHLVTNSKAATQSSTGPTPGVQRPISLWGVITAAITLAKNHPSQLLLLFAVVNIGIGLINMLPMLPLDGGHVAVATYERLRTRRGRARYVADVNKLLPVAYAFVALLLVIVVASFYLDITHPLKL